jgi:hypothetical protein
VMMSGKVFGDFEIVRITLDSTSLRSCGNVCYVRGQSIGSWSE